MRSLVSIFLVCLSTGIGCADSQPDAERPAPYELSASSQTANLFMVGEHFKVEPTASRDALLLTGSIGSPGSTETWDGVTLRVPAEIEGFASGRAVRVTVVAKRTAGSAQSFAASYWTNEVGNSGWRRFVPSATFQDHSFVYNVPTMREGKDDYVKILPDLDGDGAGLEVRSIAVEAMDRSS